MKKWCLFLVLLLGCSPKEKDRASLKVAATPVPHAQILGFVAPKLKEQKIDLKILEMDDYNLPNRSLAEREIDANFFQHIPFMENQKELFGYKIQCLAKIHLEPMGIYSKKYISLSEIPMGGMIAIPSDPTNEYRALLILERQGLIKLRDGVELDATKKDIVSNPKNLKFREIEAGMLPRTLNDVDAAAISTNFALQAGLNPKKDALALEAEDSPYINIIAIREEDKDSPVLQALKKALLSSDTENFIQKKYQGAVIPILKDCK